MEQEDEKTLQELQRNDPSWLVELRAYHAKKHRKKRKTSISRDLETEAGHT